MQDNQALKVKITIEEAWMEIANPDLSLEDAVEKLKELGNDIVEIDYENRRIKVLQGDK